MYDTEDRRDIIKQVLAGNPVAPHKIDDHIPEPLSRVISKSMARLDERYQSAQELADDLQRFLDGEAVTAKPPTRLRRARAWSRRHRMASVAIVGLLILVLLLPLTAHHFFGSATDSPTKRDLPDPTELAVSAVTEDSISLEWTSGGGTTAGFIVAYLEGAKSPGLNLRGATLIDVGKQEYCTVGLSRRIVWR